MTSDCIANPALSIPSKRSIINPICSVNVLYLAARAPSVGICISEPKRSNRRESAQRIQLNRVSIRIRMRDNPATRLRDGDPVSALSRISHDVATDPIPNYPLIAARRIRRKPTDPISDSITNCAPIRYPRKLSNANCAHANAYPQIV